MELMLTVSPRAAQNCAMLEYAVKMREQGMKQREISGTLVRKYEIHRLKAWRLAVMACDLA